MCGQKTHLLRESRPRCITLLPPALQKGFTALQLSANFLKELFLGSKLGMNSNGLTAAHNYLSKGSDPPKLGSCLQTTCKEWSLNSPCQPPWAGAIMRTSPCVWSCPRAWENSQAQLVLPHHLQFFLFLKASFPVTANCFTLHLPKSGRFNSLMSSLLLVRREVARYTEYSPTDNFPAVSYMGRSHTDSTFSFVSLAICIASNSFLARLKVKITHANWSFPATDRNRYG